MDGVSRQSNIIFASNNFFFTERLIQFKVHLYLIMSGAAQLAHLYYSYS